MSQSISEQILTDLSAFISFETTYDKPEQRFQCMQWIHEHFLGNTKHATIGEYEKNPYLYLPAKNPSWLFFGHIDVVPAEKTMFTLQNNEDKLQGRGVKDMKGAILPFLLSYKHALAKGELPNVEILLTSDEEVAGETIPYLLDQQILSTPIIAYTPDTGSADAIVTEHKGAAWVQLTVTGKGGHSAMPEKSTNPIPILAEALTSIHTSFPVPKEDDWGMTATPTMLEASQTANAIPDTATATIDVRFPKEIAPTPEQAVSLLKEYCDPSITLEIIKSCLPLYTDPSHPFITHFQTECKNIFGEEIPNKKECGATDARHFSAKHIPAFLYGPVGGGLHAKDEWVSHSSLCKHVQLYTNLLENYQ